MQEQKYLNNQSTESRVLQVASEFNGLEKSLAMLEETVAHLEGRLNDAGILSDRPEEAGKTNPPETSLVNMADRLRTSSRGADRLNARIQSILRRLEI